MPVVAARLPRLKRYAEHLVICVVEFARGKSELVIVTA